MEQYTVDDLTLMLPAIGMEEIQVGNHFSLLTRFGGMKVKLRKDSKFHLVNVGVI